MLITSWLYVWVHACIPGWNKSSLFGESREDGLCEYDIALSPIKKVSSYPLISDEHIKIGLGQSSLYSFSFMLATSNGYDITILLPGYLSKIIEFNGNKLIFNSLF